MDFKAKCADSLELRLNHLFCTQAKIGFSLIYANICILSWLGKYQWHSN